MKLGAIVLGAALLGLAAAAGEASPRKARRIRVRKAPAAAELLARQSFTSVLEVEGGPEMDLRDAPARLAQAQAAAHAQAALSDGLLERLAAEQNSSRRVLDADSCADGARNLRFVVRVAKADLLETKPSVAARKLESGLKRELEALRRSERPDDAEVSLLATDAEMELEGALQLLEQRPFRRDSLAAASRAAAALENASRLLAR